MRRSQEFKEKSQPLPQTPVKNQEMTFRKFRLLPEIVNVLETQMQVATPSPIQTMVIPHMMEGKSCIMAAQTGTGKTLAYTIPIIH
jgi:superfamily II DNA/RNA helicase